MAINVNTNVSAMTAQRYLNGAADGMQKSMERLSSGYKINSAETMPQVCKFLTV